MKKLCVRLSSNKKKKKINYMSYQTIVLATMKNKKRKLTIYYN